MATLTVSLSGSSVVNGSKAFTVTDADVQRLIDYLSERYSSSDIPPVQPTPAQALLAWVRGWVSQTASDVQAFEKQRAAITPPTFT